MKTIDDIRIGFLAQWKFGRQLFLIKLLVAYVLETD